jgi:tRNA (guanine-N7-)-methyltransferase
MELKNGKQLRRNRTFTLRQGRLTPGQENAMEVLWPKYGLEFDERNPQLFDLEQVFPVRQPVVFEIGFGNGESLVQMAAEQPQKNFIGVEVHTPGVGHCLLQIDEQQLQNLRVVQADAVEVLTYAFADESLSRVQVYFPDPWHKKRHHKRRIIQPEFVELVHSKLFAGGQLNLATDWAEYAEHMALVLQDSKLHNTTEDGAQCWPSPAQRAQTKFERRGMRLGHELFDFIYKK